MRNLTGCTLLVSLALLAGCACPPAGSGRASSGSDPGGGTFAFLGGLRCFFGGDEASKEETRPVTNADLAPKPKSQMQEVADHAAALTIR